MVDDGASGITWRRVEDGAYGITWRRVDDGASGITWCRIERCIPSAVCENGCALIRTGTLLLWFSLLEFFNKNQLE